MTYGRFFKSCGKSFSYINNKYYGNFLNSSVNSSHFRSSFENNIFLQKINFLINSKNIISNLKYDNLPISSSSSNVEMSFSVNKLIFAMINGDASMNFMLNFLQGNKIVIIDKLLVPLVEVSHKRSVAETLKKSIES
jgi:hypothetical protein